MATKHNSDCLRKADDNEPIFVLRAQDRVAPAAIRYWASLALQSGLPAEKYHEALAAAEEMEKWPRKKSPD